MQPYFFPYLGYYQLMNLVDEFIVYDEIQYSKKGWVSRNRILMNGQAHLVSLPLKKGSDFLDIKDRELADNWPQERKKVLAKIYNSYKKAPFFDQTYSLLEKIINFDEENLFYFLLNSIDCMKSNLGIDTPLVISSSIAFDKTLKSEERVLSICQAKRAMSYVNPIGGQELYKKDHFNEMGLDLKFHNMDPFTYDQMNESFISHLSIIDVMMYNSKEQVSEFLNSYYHLL